MCNIFLILCYTRTPSVVCINRLNRESMGIILRTAHPGVPPTTPNAGTIIPKSVTNLYHISSIKPRTLGGIWRTNGPLRRSSQNQVYGVLLFGVRKIDRGVIICPKIGTVMFAGPASRIPLRFSWNFNHCRRIPEVTEDHPHLPSPGGIVFPSSSGLVTCAYQ